MITNSSLFLFVAPAASLRATLASRSFLIGRLTIPQFGQIIVGLFSPKMSS